MGGGHGKLEPGADVEVEAHAMHVVVHRFVQPFAVNSGVAAAGLGKGDLVPGKGGGRSGVEAQL
jgi:hypothetical protein